MSTVVKSVSGVTAVILSVILMFLCSNAAWAKDVYKIGGIFAVTGPASFLGDPEKKSMEMAIQAINAEGGIDGHMLESVIYDTEGDPQKAVNAVSKLINKDKVIAIVGPSRTPTTLAVVPFAEKAKVPLISCAAGIKITQPVKKWVFKTAQSDVLAVAAIYAYMQNQGIKKVGLLSVSNAFGESGRFQLEQQAQAHGLEVVRAEKFGSKDTDMTAQLTKIMKNTPDAIVCWGTNPGPAVVAKNAQQLNINIPLYQSHGVASPKFIELAGDAAEGIYLPTGKILVANLLPPEDPQKQILADYIKTYQSTYNQSVSGFGGYAYDGIQILKATLKGTGGDQAKLRDNIEQLQQHVGISGVFNFSAEDHNGLGSEAFVMVRIKNGGWELIR
jgi:branched-chain amino acid transport system substrate-binding protein